VAARGLRSPEVQNPPPGLPRGLASQDSDPGILGPRALRSQGPGPETPPGAPGASPAPPA